MNKPDIGPDRYSTSQIAKITAVSLRQLQTWDQLGFVKANHVHYRRHYDNMAIRRITALKRIMSVEGKQVRRIKVSDSQLQNRYLLFGRGVCRLSTNYEMDIIRCMAASKMPMVLVYFPDAGISDVAGKDSSACAGEQKQKMMVSPVDPVVDPVDGK